MKKKINNNNKTNEMYKTRVVEIIQDMVNDGLYTSVFHYAQSIKSMQPEMYRDFVGDFIATTHMNVETSIRGQKENGTITDYVIKISVDGDTINDAKMTCVVDLDLPTKDTVSITKVKRLSTSVNML